MMCKKIAYSGVNYNEIPTGLRLNLELSSSDKNVLLPYEFYN